MSKVTIRHSRLSRYSSLAMMLLGVFTLLFISGFFGIILVVIGYLMYRFYSRQNKVAQAASGSASERS